MKNGNFTARRFAGWFRFFFLNGFAFFLCIAFLSAAAKEEKTVVVFSEGKAQTDADAARLSFRFTAYGWKVDGARKKVDRLIARFQKKLEDEKIPVAQVRAGAVQLKPSYQFNRDLKSKVPSDFLASRSLILETRDFDAVPKVMDMTLSLGSFALESARMVVLNENALLRKSFALALENGRNKANELARLAGTDIGGILRIEELESEVQDVNLILEDMKTESLGVPLNAEGENRDESSEEGKESWASAPRPVQARVKLKITFSMK